MATHLRPLRPIRTKRDYKAALAEIEKLWDARPGTPDEDHLDVLATLICAYEERMFPIHAPDPIEAIRFRMDQMGLTRQDLEPIFGSRGRVAEILNRKRPLTLPMIRALHAKLNIPAESLIGLAS